MAAKLSCPQFYKGKRCRLFSLMLETKGSCASSAAFTSVDIRDSLLERMKRGVLCSLLTQSDMGMFTAHFNSLEAFQQTFIITCV